ncbi:hypothetical protein IWX90DRAFT_107999 [Phyllosticta citrichinensis]|uniref:Secreted protein n=1 Tax=Phyllosticta citrichinensis TaxID=1130410 RepID=A0ABR1Y2S3_9PEZI
MPTRGQLSTSNPTALVLWILGTASLCIQAILATVVAERSTCAGMRVFNARWCVVESGSLKLPVPLAFCESPNPRFARTPPIKSYCGLRDRRACTRDLCPSSQTMNALGSNPPVRRCAELSFCLTCHLVARDATHLPAAVQHNLSAVTDYIHGTRTTRSLYLPVAPFRVESSLATAALRAYP